MNSHTLALYRNGGCPLFIFDPSFLHIRDCAIRHMGSFPVLSPCLLLRFYADLFAVQPFHSTHGLYRDVYHNQEEDVDTRDYQGLCLS